MNGLFAFWAYGSLATFLLALSVVVVGVILEVIIAVVRAGFVSLREATVGIGELVSIFGRLSWTGVRWCWYRLVRR